MLLIGCQDKALEAPQRADADLRTEFSQLYQGYLTGRVDHARQCLLKSVAILEKANPQKASATAHGQWLSFSRLYVLEDWATNGPLASAYLLKAQYWYLRKLELSGEPTLSAIDAVKQYDGMKCRAVVETFDLKNSDGTIPFYLTNR
jgi:hypothetical protein